MWYVYILYSESRDEFYKGISENVERRLEEHNEGMSRYTKSGIPWRIVYKKAMDDKRSAIIEEKRVKQLNRRSILLLIDG
jgi:putative endonuclease